jgi:hypothetical protein
MVENAASPDATLRGKINAEIERLATAAGNKALAGDAVNAEIAQIGALQKLLAAMPTPRRNPAILAAVIALACLVAASLALAVPVRHTGLKLVAKTTRVTLRLTGTSLWQGDWRIDPRGVRILGAKSIELPPEFTLAAPGPEQTSLNLEILEGQASLNLLKFRPQTKLTIETGPGGVTRIFAFGDMNGGIGGSFNAKGRVSGTAEPSLGTRWRLNEVPFESPPALFTFDGPGTSVTPIELRFTPLTALSLHDTPVAGLSFLDDSIDADQRPTIVSGLVSGDLTLSDTGEQIHLNEGSLLNLTGAAGVISSLQISADGMTLGFEGEARTVTLGKGNFERKLMPSILEYLMHQQRLGFFWTAAAFLWGLLWSGRKLLANV